MSVGSKITSNQSRGGIAMPGRSCGCTWLPALSSKQVIDVAIWKPTSNSMGLDALREMMLPSCPDLKLLREVTMSVGMRAKLQVLSIGSLQLKINCVEIESELPWLAAWR